MDGAQGFVDLAFGVVAALFEECLREVREELFTAGRSAGIAVSRPWEKRAWTLRAELVACSDMPGSLAHRTEPGNAFTSRYGSSVVNAVRSSSRSDRWNAVTRAWITIGCIWADSDFMAATWSGSASRAR